MDNDEFRKMYNDAVEESKEYKQKHDEEEE